MANGQAARMVFYHYDFVDDTPQLNTRGRDKLAAVAAGFPTNFLPIVVDARPGSPASMIPGSRSSSPNWAAEHSQSPPSGSSSAPASPMA